MKKFARSPKQPKRQTLRAMEEEFEAGSVVDAPSAGEDNQGFQTDVPIDVPLTPVPEVKVKGKGSKRGSISSAPGEMISSGGGGTKVEEEEELVRRRIRLGMGRRRCPGRLNLEQQPEKER